MTTPMQATLDLDITTADDLACAAAVLADVADTARRKAAFYRTPQHRAWAERATRAHAAIVRLQEAENDDSRPTG